MANEVVAYCRVSTKQQGESGLGMEGQRAAVESYARQTGARVAALYVEVESGKVADRPQLAKALAHARRSKATLVVAKLDRLSRNVEFLAKVMNSAVDFIACDNPAANRLTLHILAAVAEAEAKAISDRTKAALAAAKARGTLLGSARPGHWEGREEARLVGARAGAKAGAKARVKAAAEAYADLLPVLADLRAKGLSLQAIADELTKQGHTTRRGRPWNPVQVSRVLGQTGWSIDPKTGEHIHRKTGMRIDPKTGERSITVSVTASDYAAPACKPEDRRIVGTLRVE